MARSNLTLLTPPQEKEEIHPYRRPWRSIGLETGILLAVTLVLYGLTNILNLRFPGQVGAIVSLGVALLPLGLWLVFSWWAERSVPQPRQRLLAVVVISGLVANAVGIPFINDFLRVDHWLPLASAINRIIGYTFTVGIAQELLKYLVVRYAVWPDCFRTRTDAIAYGAASAVGYATILNVHFVITNAAPPGVTAVHVFDTLALHLVTSLIMGYGLAEIRFGLPTPLFLTSTLALSAFVTGVTIPVRAGLVNPGFSLTVSDAKILLSLVFALALLMGFSMMISFLYASAERREQEAATEER